MTSTKTIKNCQTKTGATIGKQMPLPMRVQGVKDDEPARVFWYCEPLHDAPREENPTFGFYRL